jgi:rSAM/selenodomain-associated transferase 2
MTKSRFSVIVPVFQEQEAINHAVDHLRKLEGGSFAELIVVDGDWDGSTIRQIRDAAVKKIFSEKGRGNQLNKGASVAEGDILIFLHADTRLPMQAFERIEAAMANTDCIGGAFDLRIDSPRRAFRIIETAASWRSRLTRVPYGDQAIFLRAASFRTLGGFRNIPIMEDVELMQRIKRDNGKIAILKDRATTSARRWEKEGILWCTLRNWLLITLYLYGVKPERLAGCYR